MNEGLLVMDQECSALIKDDQLNGLEGSLSTALIFLICLELIAIVMLYIKEGGSGRLVFYLASLLLMLLLYKLMVSAKQVPSLSLLDNKQEDDLAAQLSRKLNYLKVTIENNLARIKGLKWFYSIIVPIFMLTIHQFFQDKVGFSWSLWVLPVLVAINLIIWTSFFKSAMDKLLVMNYRVNYLNSLYRLKAKH